MKKNTIISYISVFIALVIAFAIFIKFNPENLIRKNESPITLDDIANSKNTSFIGKPAGKDINQIVCKEDFEKMIFNVQYATTTPVNVIKTNVYSLKTWVNPYKKKNSKRQTGVGKRKASVIQSNINYHEDYIPYYIIKLPDNSHILAQMSQTTADKINSGEKIALPIGQKIGIPQTAKNYLSDICKQYGASTKGIFYTLDENWYKENYFVLLIIRGFTAFIGFIIIATFLIIAIEKLIKFVNNTN